MNKYDLNINLRANKKTEEVNMKGKDYNKWDKSYSKAIAVWMLSLTIIILTVILFSKGDRIRKALLLGIFIFGWGLFLSIILQGLKKRRFQKIIEETNKIISIYHKDKEYGRAVEDLKAIKPFAQNKEEEKYLDFIIASIFFKAEKYDQALKIVGNIDGFSNDPSLQEEYLYIKEKLNKQVEETK